MPKLLFIILNLFVFISCNNKKSDINPVLPSEPQIITIIDFIANSGEVKAGSTGYGGEKSDQYKRYEWMKSKLSDSSLHLLTDHKSPAVRVYAFFALAERKSLLLRDIAEKHKNDSASFTSQSGCFGMPDQVNKCFLRVIKGRSWFASIDEIVLSARKK